MTFVKDAQQEQTRPEWDVKRWYLDLFSECSRAYRLYTDHYMRSGQSNPAMRSEWLCKLGELAIVLWAKLNKNKEKTTQLWPCLIKLSNHETCSDEEAYQAMKELSTFFEIKGYTKVEDEFTPAWRGVIEER